MPARRSSPCRPARSLTAGLIGLGVGLWLAAFAGRAADSTAQREYQVKAGFLFNFAKLVEWPATTNLTATNFVIGVVDDGKVFPVIAATLTNKSVNGQPVTLRAVASPDEAGHCHILFLTRPRAAETAAFLAGVSNAPVLTVGEAPGFARAGGRINFLPRGEFLRFEVNLKSAGRAGLKISSKVAALATVVEEEAAP